MPLSSAQPVRHPVDGLPRESSLPVDEVHLPDRLPFPNRPVPPAVLDHLGIEKSGSVERRCGSPRSRTLPGDRIDAAFLPRRPCQPHEAVAGFGRDRGPRRRHRELVVRVVDELHGVHVLAQLEEIGAVGQRQAERSRLPALERERPERQTEGDVVVLGTDRRSNQRRSVGVPELVVEDWAWPCDSVVEETPSDRIRQLGPLMRSS